jgi:hypothetical protein
VAKDRIPKNRVAGGIRIGEIHALVLSASKKMRQAKRIATEDGAKKWAQIADKSSKEIEKTLQDNEIAS